MIETRGGMAMMMDSDPSRAESMPTALQCASACPMRKFLEARIEEYKAIAERETRAAMHYSREAAAIKAKAP